MCTTHIYRDAYYVVLVALPVFCTFLNAVGRQVPEMGRERLKFVYTEGKRTRKRNFFFNICRCLQRYSQSQGMFCRHPERCSEPFTPAAPIQSLWAFSIPQESYQMKAASGKAGVTEYLDSPENPGLGPNFTEKVGPRAQKTSYFLLKAL